MSLEIMTDPRVRSVKWNDLVEVSPFETAYELLLSLPWLLLSLVLANYRLYPFALGASFMFFLAGLRQVHNAHHYALGLSRGATEWVIYIMSALMLGSMHAVQFNHLEHHKHCMDDEDMEALSARMGALKAIFFGPAFPILLHWNAWKNARPRIRRWMLAELMTSIVLGFVVFGIMDIHALQYHFAVMAVGQCLTAFFAVWTVHHDCGRSHFIARTLRNKLKNFVSMNMFYHVEHHLFPRVPTFHLPKLAERLDQKAPELCKKTVF
jgi:fatty acid desaturase